MSKSIIIGFSKSKKSFAVGSWVIRAYQGWTEYSHVYIRQKIDFLFPSDLITHASEGNVQRMSGTQFDKNNQTVSEFEVEIPDIMVYNRHRKKNTLLRNLIREEMHEISGDKYGFMQNIGIFLVDIVDFIFGVEIKNPWGQGWNCSEFTSFILKIIFPEEFKELDKDVITPKQVNLILEKLAKEGKIKKLKIALN